MSDEIYCTLIGFNLPYLISKIDHDLVISYVHQTHLPVDNDKSTKCISL